MKQIQKAIMVTSGVNGTEGLADLNEHLVNGWRTVTVSPMGGAACAPGQKPQALFAALVIIERAGKQRADVLEMTEEEVEELVEEKLDGKVEEKLSNGEPPLE